MRHERRPVEGAGRVPAGVERGQVDEHGAEEGEGDPDRADDDVLPRRLERSLGPAVADQEGGRRPSSPRSPPTARPGWRPARRGAWWRRSPGRGRRRGWRDAGAAPLGDLGREVRTPSHVARRAMAPMTMTMKALSASARRTPPRPDRSRRGARPGRRARSPIRGPPRRWRPRPADPGPPASGRQHHAAEQRQEQQDAQESSVVQLRELVEVDVAELAPEALGQDQEDDDAEQHVEGRAELDEQWDTGGARGRPPGRCRCRRAGARRSGRRPSAASPGRRSPTSSAAKPTGMSEPGVPATTCATTRVAAKARKIKTAAATSEAGTLTSGLFSRAVASAEPMRPRSSGMTTTLDTDAPRAAVASRPASWAWRPRIAATSPSATPWTASDPHDGAHRGAATARRRRRRGPRRRPERERRVERSPFTARHRDHGQARRGRRRRPAARAPGTAAAWP